jgi:hypothetical protein
VSKKGMMISDAKKQAAYEKLLAADPWEEWLDEKAREIVDVFWPDGKKEQAVYDRQVVIVTALLQTITREQAEAELVTAWWKRTFQRERRG